MEADRGFGRQRLGLLRAFIILVTSCVAASGAAGFIGVNVKYPKREVEAGQLPKAEHVVDLLEIIQVQHIKLQHDPHPSIFDALSGSGIQVLLTVPEDSIPVLARSQEAASEWLDWNVLPHFPSTEVTGIVMGEELNPSSILDLVEAAKKLCFAIEAAGLKEQIKVSASLSMQRFSHWGHHPSLATFRDNNNHVRELLDFVAATDSYLMINVDPFEAHLHDGFSLDFAMLSAEPELPHDDGYSNLLDAAIDSAYNAMEKLGFSSVPVVVGAVGWPWTSSESESDGFSSSSAATVENAVLFSESLVKHVQSKRGTPSRPESNVSVYVHELFDIVGEADNGTERRRYGLYSSSQVPTHRFDLSPEVSEAEILMRRVLADNGTNGTTGGPSGGGMFCVAKPGASDNVLSVGLNWACGQGNADCTPIQQNGACFLPDTYSSHASYAFNNYYQRNAASGATCDFQGAAQLTSTDPSYSNCIYTSSGSSSGGGTNGSTGGGTGTGSSTGGILQPFNPSSNTSDAEAFHTTIGVTFMLAVLVWTWRF